MENGLLFIPSYDHTGCGSVGKAVASDTTGPWFESRIWKIIIMNIVTVEKMKIKKEEAKNCLYFLKKKFKKNSTLFDKFVCF